MDRPLYNSRITKAYVDYLVCYRPEYDVDAALERAGISRFELEDPAHWFTQDQVDRFQDIVARETRIPNLSREAGRFGARSPGMGAARRYTLGLLNPASVYLLAGKVAALFSRGARIKARRLGPRQIEITADPNPGVREKPYQCENRLGSLEAVSLLFSHRMARVEHPECVHRGGTVCRYLVHIPFTPHAFWRRARNAALLVLIPASLTAVFALPVGAWIPAVLGSALAVVLLHLQTERLEKQDLIRTLQTQGEVARGELDDMRTRANHALLIQGVGQAAASLRDEDALVHAVLEVLVERLDFDRALIVLGPPDGGPLNRVYEKGHPMEQARMLREADGGSPFQETGDALRRRTPVSLGDVDAVRRALPAGVVALLERLEAREGVCAPMICEQDLVGLLVVHHRTTSKPLTQSDLRLLEGVASHIAVGVVNARSYRRLESSEQSYRELVQAANSVILRTDPAGRITFFNRFAEELFGFSSTEILGRSLVGTLLPDTREAADELKELLAALQEDRAQPVAREARNLRRNGESVWIAWTYRPLFDRNGRMKEVLCIGNDVTEMAEARREREALRNRLHRARRMEAVGALAGGVAHELNNILSGIVSYPELLLMDLSSQSPLRKPVETIREAGNKAAEIVQDMLLLSRRGVTATEPLSLNHIVRMTLDSADHRSLAERHPGVHVACSLEHEPVRTLGSPEHLVRALQSLILNGFLAMERGTLGISTRSVILEQGHAGYERVEAGNYAVLEVSDEGPVLRPEDLERIFEPFYTKKFLKRAGTGLGLPVVWGIVKDHLGFVDVRSGPGPGTTFTLYLPSVAEGPGREAAPGEDAGARPGKGETILVVDDIAEQRTIAAGILGRLGYRVVSMASGEAALEYLKAHSVDLVVLDMVMDPGMDGLETYQGMLKVRPGQKAVLASGYAETGRVQEARRLGAGAYLRKPYTVEKLGRAVRRELDR